MVRDDNTRFRITLWPGEPLPHPPFTDRVLSYLDGELLLPDWDAGLVPASPDASQEMYLELVALDLSDADAILGWVNRYGGPLGMRQCAVTGPRTGLAGFYMYEGAEEIAEELTEGHLRAAGAAGAPDGMGETLDEFRWGALCIRDLVSAWRVVLGEIDHRTHQWESPVWALNGNSKTETHPWDEKDGPTSLLAAGLGFSLESFSPEIRTTEHPLFNDLWNYELCCLELFNHMVEGNPYKTCANERCGRLFVRQKGRALHGQHRTTGVKYCSSECARAQAQREYRRRAKLATSSASDA